MCVYPPKCQNLADIAWDHHTVTETVLYIQTWLVCFMGALRGWSLAQALAPLKNRGFFFRYLGGFLLLFFLLLRGTFLYVGTLLILFFSMRAFFLFRGLYCPYMWTGGLFGACPLLQNSTGVHGAFAMDRYMGYSIDILKANYVTQL